MKWVFGRHSVQEIIASGTPVKKILLSESSEKDYFSFVFSLAQKKNIPIERVPKKIIDSLVNGNHQGIAALTESKMTTDFKSFISTLDSKSKTFLCLLDEIQDPQNLGAIIRNAVCFGCGGIIIPKWRSASVTETVMKSSSGASAYIPVIEIPNLTVAIERLKEKGFFIFGADVSGNCSLDTVDFELPLALVLGNEHRGIKPILKKACDQLVSISQSKTVASLNVSSASAVFFYEIYKRAVR